MSPDTLFDMVKRAIGMEDVIAKFEEGYEDPVFEPVEHYWLCERCGALVYKKGKHKRWHRDISLEMHMLMGWSVRHLYEHLSAEEATPEPASTATDGSTRPTGTSA